MLFPACFYFTHNVRRPNMIKLNASYSKKVPAELDYSSKSFMACVEVELPTGASARELQAKIHDTFALVKQSVEEEINGRTAQSPATTSQQPQGERQSQSRGPEVRATNKQVQYILSLGKDQRLGLPELNRQVAELYGAGNVYDLSKRDASRFVDILKAAA
jgi:hypothetical protein